jgi:hypothetical protein
MPKLKRLSAGNYKAVGEFVLNYKAVTVYLENVPSEYSKKTYWRWSAIGVISTETVLETCGYSTKRLCTEEGWPLMVKWGISEVR